MSNRHKVACLIKMPIIPRWCCVQKAVDIEKSLRMCQNFSWECVKCKSPTHSCHGNDVDFGTITYGGQTCSQSKLTLWMEDRQARRVVKEWDSGWTSPQLNHSWMFSHAIVFATTSVIGRGDFYCACKAIANSHCHHWSLCHS